MVVFIYSKSNRKYNYLKFWKDYLFNCTSLQFTVKLQLYVLNLQSIHFSLKYFFHTDKTFQYFDLMMPNWRLYLATVYTIGTGCSSCNRHCVNHLDCDSGGCGFWSSTCKCYNCRKKNQVYNLWIQLYRFYTYRIPRGIITLLAWFDAWYPKSYH